MLSLSAGALATGLAGCVGDGDGGEDRNGVEESATNTKSPNNTTSSAETSSPAHEFKSPPYENVETEENGSTTTVTGEIVLESGEYAQQEFELEETAQLQITGGNEGEGTLDLFLLSPESEFEKYTEAESAIFSGGFAETDIETIERTVDVSSGSYFFVFDNTAVYGAEPQGTVRFEFQYLLETGTQTPTEDETENNDTENEGAPEGENNAEIVKESDMPKIRKVTDNFGHTFIWDPEENPDQEYSDEGFYPTVEEEVVVSDDTTVTLTVEEILANSEDDISYSYVFGSSARDHPDNTRPDERIRSNTHTWDMRRDDYTSGWRFQVYFRNGDDIHYDNESIQTDFKVRVGYPNLTLD